MGDGLHGVIDLVIERDGQWRTVQCKQWQGWKAGVKVVREVLEGMTAKSWKADRDRVLKLLEGA